MAGKMTRKERLALAFARKAHEGQKRKYDGKPYVTHPIKVREILKGVTENEDVLCTALLHDVIEDTSYTYADIENAFGKRIADLVLEVSKDENHEFSNLKTNDGLLVKLADMLHNISDNKNEGYLEKKIRFIKTIRSRRSRD